MFFSRIWQYIAENVEYLHSYANLGKESSLTKLCSWLFKTAKSRYTKHWWCLQWGRGTWRDNERVQVQEVEQTASKSTVCSRILSCALFSSSGAISCSYPSFGISTPWERRYVFFKPLFLAEHNTYCLPLCIFNKMLMTACHYHWKLQKKGRDFWGAPTVIDWRWSRFHCCFWVWFLGRLDILHPYSCASPHLLYPGFSSLSSSPFTFHSGQLSLVQLDCFVRAHHLHSD